jgi:hypothetical protein
MQHSPTLYTHVGEKKQKQFVQFNQAQNDLNTTNHHPNRNQFKSVISKVTQSIDLSDAKNQLRERNYIAFALYDITRITFSGH